MVGYHVPGGERPVEAQSVEPGEPAERHVRLAGGEQGAGAEFDPRVAERPALAFVDGDRPRGFERELPVGADGPGFQAGGGPSILAFFLVVVLVPVLFVLVGFDEDGSVDLPFVGGRSR